MFLGKGGGGFAPPVAYPVPQYATVPASADLSGAGHLDIAVSVGGLGGQRSLGVLRGNGDGTFQPVATYYAGGLVDWIGIADFNGDGRTDLAVANGIDGRVSILLNCRP